MPHVWVASDTYATCMAAAAPLCPFGQLTVDGTRYPAHVGGL